MAAKHQEGSAISLAEGIARASKWPTKGLKSGQPMVRVPYTSRFIPCCCGAVSKDDCSCIREYMRRELPGITTGLEVQAEAA